MNSHEMNWLLQTIETPEAAKRFVQAQYKHGRITYRVMASLARDRGWADWSAWKARRLRFQWSSSRHGN
jgi:hypothetical protein